MPLIPLHAAPAASCEPAPVRIAVVLPAYNEAQTIAAVIEDFYKACPEAEIVVVDNNSKDDTAALATAALTRLGANGRVLSERVQGKANAIRRAFHTVDADVYVMADADCTYKGADLARLMAPVLCGEADMVVDDRHAAGDYAKENKRPLHGFGNSLVRNIINGVFRANLGDILSGYRVFSRRFVKTYPILVRGFELETDLTLHALDKRLAIVELPITYADRPAGSVSKLNTLRDGVRVLNTVVHIMRHNRPLMFFGALAAVCAGLGIIAGIPAILDYIRFSYVYHLPLAVLASSLELVALLLLVAGLILDSISRFHRIEFELRLLDHERK